MYALAASLLDRPLEQWKVTELKDELRRRKLIIKGNKDELVRRLEEAVSNDGISEENDLANGFNPEDDSLDKSGDGEDKDKQSVEGDHNGLETVKVEEESHNADSIGSGDVGGLVQIEEVGVLSKKPGVELESESEVVDSTCIPVEKSVPIGNDAADQVDDREKEVKDESPVAEESRFTMSEHIYQVSEKVSQVIEFPVKYESVSTDSVSINQDNELKDNLNTDNVHLEPVIVKREVKQPLSDNESLLDVQVQGGEQIAMENVESTEAMDVESCEKALLAVEPLENSNFDGKLVQESIEEDGSESKHTDVISNEDESKEKCDIPESLLVEEDNGSDSTLPHGHSDKKDELAESSGDLPQLGAKRKIVEEPLVESEPSKRLRKWNNGKELVTDGSGRPQKPERGQLKLDEATQISTGAVVLPKSLTPRDKSTTPKPFFSRSNSSLDVESPKERIVPPPLRSPTTSLKVDKFLRPFTLKAVEELLAKTGTVCSFWMDHIKTHCYVMYSSVEEAVATRDSLYNLQWPPNGGRLLTAEFVEPEDVKLRAEGVLQSPTATTPSNLPQQSHQPPLKLPPPPPLSQLPPPHLRQQLPPPPPPLPSPSYPHPGTARERLPPPPPKELEPPVVTLDDLFKKTQATPRIYYLPLSEEKVAAKLGAAVDSRNKRIDGRSRN